jgi:hypothetical protein
MVIPAQLQKSFLHLVSSVLLWLTVLAASTASALTAQTITGFAPATPVLFSGGTFTLSATGGASGNPVVFSSGTTSICTVSGSTVTKVAVGTCTLRANQAGNATYSAAPQVSKNVVINKGTQTITFAAISGKGFGAAPFTVPVTASSSLGVALTSTTTTVCTVSGSTVTIAALGTCTIAANQAGNTNYNAAAQVTQSFTVAKGAQTITFAALTGKTLGAAPFTISATASSGLAVAFTSTTTAVCTVAGTTVTLVSAGTCTLAANQAGNTNFNVAAQVTQSFAVSAAAKTNQTITFAAIANTTLGTPLTLTGITATSGLAVAMTSATTTICTVSGFTVTLVATGTCTLRANQAGNASFNAAPQISQSFTVLANSKTNQTISFSAIPNDSIYWGGATVTNVYATSGLAVILTTATPTVCTVGADPNTPGGLYITYLAQGACTIRANQPGDATYNAAPQVSRSFTVQPPLVAISITSPANNATFTAPANIPIVVNTSVFGSAPLAQIDYYRNGVLVASTPTNTPVTFSNLGVGTYTLFAEATSGAPGYVQYYAQSQSITITVVPPVYTVALTSPPDGSTYMAPATISLAATATPTAPATSIARVDFYRGTTLIGTSTTAPFNFVWTGAPAGGYRLTAVATDNLGVARTSAVVYTVVDSADTCINAPPLASAESATKLATLGQLPITFEENIGQTNPAVRFQARTPGFQLFLTENERVMVAQSQAASMLPAKRDRAPLANVKTDTQGRSVAVRMSYIGANPHPRMTGIELSEQRSHYLVNDDANQSHTDIRHLAKAHYHDIYPGIDEVYYGKEGKLEYDLRVAPGANPNVIRVAFKDVESVTVDESGDLLLTTPLGILVQKKPVAYQEIDGERHEVVASYKVDAANEVSFDVGSYDAAHTLVIDPVVVYSTLVGGSNGYSAAYSIAVSRCGEAYIAGVTQTTDFPTTPGALDTVGNATLAAGRYVGFVSKLNPAGTALMYSTYISGTNKADSASTTLPYNIVLDPTGHAYIAGYTTDSAFPATPGSVYTTSQAQTSPFVAKLNNAGNGLVYATYLPNDTGAAIAVDAAGAAYIAGANLVYKINPTGRSIDYKMPVGYAGPNPPISQVDPKTLGNATAIAVDATGHAYVTGTVAYDLAVTPGAFQTVKPSTYFATGGRSGFVSKINPAGNGFIYSTYLGNTSDTLAYSIAVDATGNAYVAGQSKSIDAPPNYLGAVRVFNNDGDLYTFEYGFAAKLNASGSQLDYYSLIGGGSCNTSRCGFASTTIGAIRVDSLGGAWITGTSTSNQIPTVNALPGLAGGNDFAAKFSPTGANLIFSTPLGVGGAVGSAAIDNADSVYIAGLTSNPNFPTTANAFQRTLSAGATSSAFVLKINQSRDTSLTLIATPNPSVAGGSVTLAATITGKVPTGTVTFYDGTNVLGTSNVSGGIATISKQFIGGIYTSLRAEYSGDANNNSSNAALPYMQVTSPNVYPTVTLSGIADGANLFTDSGQSYSSAKLVVNAFAAPGNLLKTVSIEPYTHGWQLAQDSLINGISPTTWPPGLWFTYATATDNFNHTTTSAPVRFLVSTAGVAKPTISITSPTNGSTAQAPITFTVNVAPASGSTIRHVELYSGDKYSGIGYSEVAPYSMVLDNAPAGTYPNIALAVDSSGSVSISAPVTVTIIASISPPPAPNLRESYPRDGGALLIFEAPRSAGGSPITSYTATCSAAGRPTVTASAAAAPGNFGDIAITGLAGGITYSCTVAAVNSFGVGLPSNSLNVVAKVTAVSISITTPLNNATLRTASSTRITATAQSGSIALARVEIFVDGVSQGVYVPPVSPVIYAQTIDADWANPTLGSHSISAQMTNANGTVTNSTPITVQVIDSPRVSLVSPSSFYLAPAAIDLLAIATPPATPAGTTITKVEYLNGVNVITTVTTPPYAYRWRNVAAGTYSVTARVTDSNGVTATSTPLTITVGTSGSITPASGINGSIINDNTVTFAGTFNAPPNASVTVNGQVATITADGRFFINDLALQPGSNTLTLAINSPAGPVTTQTITVTRSNTVAPFKLNVTPTQGLAPVATTLEITNPGGAEVGSVLVSCDNPTKSATSASVTSYAALGIFTCAYPKPGVYMPWVQVKNASGQAVYESSKAVVVSDPLETYAIVRSVYFDMEERLKAGDATGAANLFSEASRPAFSTFFVSLGSSLTTAGNQLGQLQGITITENHAELIVIRTTASGPTAFPIHITRDPDGVWRIESM